MLHIANKNALLYSWCKFDLKIRLFCEVYFCSEESYAAVVIVNPVSRTF